MPRENDSLDSEERVDTGFDTPPDLATRSVVVTSDGLGSATGEIEQQTYIDQVQSALLVVEDGPDVGLDFEVRGTVRVGRARENDVILVDPGVGRSHLLITSDHGMWRMQDLQSANGTRLNGSYIAGSTPLFHGDTITIGRSTLRFETNSGSYAERTAAGTAPDALDNPARATSPEQLASSSIATATGRARPSSRDGERRRSPAGTPVSRDVIGRSGAFSVPSAMLGTPAPALRPSIATRPTLVDGTRDTPRAAHNDLRYSARILLFAGGWAVAVVLLALLIRLLR